MSINNDNCYLAYPGSATIGEVQVFDTVNLVRVLSDVPRSCRGCCGALASGFLGSAVQPSLLAP